MNLAEQFQQLKALHDQGILTDEEFSQAKKKLIDGVKVEEPTVEAYTAQSRVPLREPSVLHQLSRSYEDRWIGGVCGGLATSTNIPSWSWRLLFVLLTLLHGVGIILYILLWIFVPLKIEIVTRKPVPAESSESVVRNEADIK